MAPLSLTPKNGCVLKNIHKVDDEIATQYGIFNKTIDRVEEFMRVTQREYGLEDILV